MTTKEDIYNQSLSWLMKQNEGLEKFEEKEFLLWIEDEKNKEAYEKNKDIFFSYSILNDIDKDDIGLDIKKDHRIKNFKKLFAPLAASVIFLCACFGGFTYYENSKSLYKQNFYTVNNGKRNIVLPDNSVLDLDVKTEVFVDYYKNERLLTLKKGKAVFSVSKDKNRVFRIKSGKNIIEVLGTKFEVINLKNITRVNVIEGKVRVSHIYNENKEAKNLRVLTKEQSILVNEKGKVLAFTSLDLKDIANWKKGILKFKKASLKEVFEEFERYHDYRANFENYELSALNISGVFTINKFDEFLQSLAEIYPLKIKKENNILHILENK